MLIMYGEQKVKIEQAGHPSDADGGFTSDDDTALEDLAQNIRRLKELEREESEDPELEAVEQTDEELEALSDEELREQIELHEEQIELVGQGRVAPRRSVDNALR